jgi:hypothetical protein
MAEICRRPLVYRALIVSLNVTYPEELAIIHAIKSRFKHVDVWLTDIDGRQASLAEAMRLGADGLLSNEGLHRTAGADEPPLSPPTITSITPPPTGPKGPSSEKQETAQDAEPMPGDPILTADELRALLHEQPTSPSDESSE